MRGLKKLKFKGSLPLHVLCLNPEALMTALVPSAVPHNPAKAPKQR
jgi:hypothetical protein